MLTFKGICFGLLHSPAKGELGGRVKNRGGRAGGDKKGTIGKIIKNNRVNHKIKKDIYSVA